MLPKIWKPIIELDKKETKFEILCFVNKACLVIVYLCCIGIIYLWVIRYNLCISYKSIKWWCFSLIILFMNKLNQLVRIFAARHFLKGIVLYFNSVISWLPPQSDPAASSNDEKRHGTCSRVSNSDVPPSMWDHLEHC